MKAQKSIFIILILTLVFSGTAIAGGGGHNHHFGIFGGVTNNLDAEHSDFSIGADYEYFLPFGGHHFGVGVIGDIVFADHTEYLAMGGVFFHPSPSFKLVIGNGIAAAEHEVHLVHVDEGHKALAKKMALEADGEAETEWATHHVLRIGAAYDFHVGGFSISPTFNYDIIDSHGYAVYGLTFGVGF